MSNSFRINKDNKDSLIKGRINMSNSAGSIVNNNPLSNKFSNNEIKIKNSPTQRDKKKRNKISSIFSDFFTSNSDKKNSSLDYNSFKDSNSLNLEMSNSNNNNDNSNKKVNTGFFNKKYKNDEKNFSLIEEKSSNDLDENNQAENNNLSNENDFSEPDKYFSKVKLSPKDKLDSQNTNSFSSTSENNKIDKQNYILESEINLSKPITIKDILNAANNKTDNEEKAHTKSSKEKNKFTRSKIKDFIKEKILKNKTSSEVNSKNNDNKNLYENLKFNYSELESDNTKNQHYNTFSKKKYDSNENERNNQINNIEREVDYETDPEDLRKIDEVVKREVNLHSPKGKDKILINSKSPQCGNSPDILNENKNKNEIINNANNSKKNTDLIDINVNVNFNQNKKYNNLVEEELDAEASSNTDEENMSDISSDKSSINKQTSFISVKLNEENNNEIEDSIITKINQLENRDNNKQNPFDLLAKDSLNNNNKNNLNINKNLLEEFERKGNTMNTSQFPKFEEIFGEKIETQTEQLKKSSLFGNFETYTLFKVIVKNGEDLRQEQFATQLINEFHQIFKMEKVDCWVNTYEILATGNNAGIIEVVPNSISLDQLKRKAKGITSLRHFFEVYYGPENGKKFKNAMKNFISSLAGYSLVCYFLQIKDRHNANILIDDVGHLIHIDFGFMFTNAPGKGIKFEKAPFKLTKEFVDVMGGVNSKTFQKFRKLLWK